MRTLRVSALVLVAMFASQYATVSFAQGATFYVSTSGNDANPGTLQSPWRTVRKAATTLTAGQTALIRGGTYAERDIPFSNSGTAGNPITLKNYPSETPVIDGGYTTSSGRHPVFYIDGKNYITLDGLTIQRGSTANIYLAYSLPTRNITIQNCHILNYVTADNGAAIYVDTSGVDELIIQDNSIHDRIQGGQYNNVGNGIVMFRGVDITIRNNEIYNQVVGVYYKHNNPGTMATLVENNLIHNNDKGILWTMHDAVIRNNVIYGNRIYGLKIHEEAGTCNSIASNNNQVLHNTLVDNANGIILEDGGCVGAVNTVLRDNIVHNFTSTEYRGVSIFAYLTLVPSVTTLDHNLIYSSSVAQPIRVLNSAYSLLSLPLTAIVGSGNVQSAPNFRNYAGRDYTLLAGPGKSAGSDGQDMGANISQVGIRNGAAVPARPTNLRIVP